MYQRLLTDAAFYRLLLRFDEELAAAERPKGCRVCGEATGGVRLPPQATRLRSRSGRALHRTAVLLLRGSHVPQAPHAAIASSAARSTWGP